LRRRQALAHRFDVEAAAVVAHRDREPAAAVNRRTHEVPRARVAQHVVDRFLRDAEARGVGVGRGLRRVLGLEVRLQAGDARLRGRVQSAPRRRAEIVGCSGPQAERSWRTRSSVCWTCHALVDACAPQLAAAAGERLG
jgi:hypothetical protein